MIQGWMRVLTVSSLAAALGACSGGGSGGGGGSSTNQASGAFSVPNLNCGTTPCISSSARLLNTGLNSGEEIAAYGELVYNHFNNEALPQVNALLYRVEQAFKNHEIETCEEIQSIPAESAHDLGEGYSAYVTSDVTIPSPFGGSATKLFMITSSSQPVMAVAVGCSGTVRNFYVRAVVDSTTRYEVWAKTDSANPHAKSVEAAADSNGAKLTLQFQSGSATEFTLAAVGKSYPNPYLPGETVDFSMFGQANLTSDAVKIAYSNDNASAPPTSFSAVETNWNLTSIGHCYSAFSQWTVDADGSACSSLSFTSPTTSRVRSNSGTVEWKVDAFSLDIADFTDK